MPSTSRSLGLIGTTRCPSALNARSALLPNFDRLLDAPTTATVFTIRLSQADRHGRQRRVYTSHSHGVLVHEPFVPVRSNTHALHHHDCGRRRPARRIGTCAARRSE